MVILLELVFFFIYFLLLKSTHFYEILRFLTKKVKQSHLLSNVQKMCHVTAPLPKVQRVKRPHEKNAMYMREKTNLSEQQIEWVF